MAFLHKRPHWEPVLCCCNNSDGCHPATTQWINNNTRHCTTWNLLSRLSYHLLLIWPVSSVLSSNVAMVIMEGSVPVALKMKSAHLWSLWRWCVSCVRCACSGAGGALLLGMVGWHQLISVAPQCWSAYHHCSHQCHWCQHVSPHPSVAQCPDSPVCHHQPGSRRWWVDRRWPW